MTLPSSSHWICEFCKDNNHEACPIFEMFRNFGLMYCSCICNTKVFIPQ